MKKIFPWMMLLAIAGVMVAGCGKAEEKPAEGTPAATEKPAGEEAK